MAKSRSLSWRLGVSTLVIVLPLVIFALIMVAWIAHDEREAERNELIGDAYAFADTVGREINAYFLLSAALSHSRPFSKAICRASRSKLETRWPRRLA